MIQCPVPLLFFDCFLHRRKSISNGVQTPRNFLWIFYGPEDIQWAREASRGALRGHNPSGRAWGPRRAQVGCAHLGGLPHPLLHYKFPNILKPLGVSLDQKFRRRNLSVSTKTNLDPVPAPCRRGESSPVAIFIIQVATTMRRE